MKAEVLCPACSNPSRDGGLCDHDETVLADVLKHAPDLLDELLTQTVRLNVSTISGGKSSEEPLPINLKASELAAGYETLLMSWALACGAKPGTLNGSGRDAARWLAERIYDVRVHEAAGELVSELIEHARACWRVVDRYGTDTEYLGDCTALLPPNDIECRTPLRVKKGAKKVTCWRCDAAYVSADLIAIRDETIDGSLATAREIAAALFRTPDGRLITRRMIEGYAERGTILSHGIKHNKTLNHDTPTYSIAEVKRAAMEAKYPRARVGKGSAA